MTQSYDKDNIFAKMLRGEIPNHTVYEDDKTLAFMDIMPMAKGHVLVIPKCEAVELSDMPADYIQAVFATAQKVMNAQRKALNTEGVIQLQLNHERAGQSVFHYHVHLIPAHITTLREHAQTGQQAEDASPDALANLAKQFAGAIAE